MLSAKLIRSVEQYILEMRKSKIKVKENDGVVEMLMQKQIFYVFLTNYYDI